MEEESLKILLKVKPYLSGSRVWSWNHTSTSLSHQTESHRIDITIFNTTTNITITIFMLFFSDGYEKKIKENT